MANHTFIKSFRGRWRGGRSAKEGRVPSIRTAWRRWRRRASRKEKEGAAHAHANFFIVSEAVSRSGAANNILTDKQGHEEDSKGRARRLGFFFNLHRYEDYNVSSENKRIRSSKFERTGGEKWTRYFTGCHFFTENETRYHTQGIFCCNEVHIDGTIRISHTSRVAPSLRNR